MNNMIAQSLWSAVIRIEDAAPEERKHEVRYFWMTDFADPYPYAEKRVGPNRKLHALGLVGRSREVTLEQIEAESEGDANWMVQEPKTFASAYGPKTEANVPAVAELTYTHHNTGEQIPVADTPDEEIRPLVIKLGPGQRVRIELDETDGAFDIIYGKTRLTVGADLPDSSQREGIIYSEDFGVSHSDPAYSDVQDIDVR